jgi:soluble lytic murein transglycosylase-like protein
MLGDLIFKSKIKIQHEHFKKKPFSRISKLKFSILLGFLLALTVVILEFTNDNFISNAFARSIENDIVYTGNIVDKSILTGSEKKEIKFYLNLTKNIDIALNIFKYSRVYNVEPDLMLAIMKIESRYRANTVNFNYNKSIDRGLFQLNSNSFPYLKEEDFFDTGTNIDNGTKYLRWCLDQTDNNLVKSLAIYNAGIGNLAGNKIGKNTLEYIQKVLDEMDYIDKQREKFIKNL